MVSIEALPLADSRLVASSSRCHLVSRARLCKTHRLPPKRYVLSAGQKITSPALDSGSAVVDTCALGSNGGNNNNQRQEQHPRHTTLDASQTARALYPSIARSLQKYLRLTRQPGRHNLQSIYEHLSKCLLYGLSARTFIEKFVQRDPVWQLSETELFANCRLETDASRPARDDFEVNTWSLICDTFVSREINSGTFFLLRQGQVSLLVTVAKLPHTNINEEMLDKRMCKFALGSKDSETSSV